jgi:hypothetical protein
MEHISTISKSNLAKPLLLSVIDGLSLVHGTEWQNTVVGTMASGFECPIFVPAIGKYTLQLAYLRFLSISCEEERNILRRIKKRKANCIGHTLRTKWLLKTVIDGKIDGNRRRRRRRRRRRNRLQQLRNYYKDKRIMEIGRGSTRSHSVEKWLWKRL